MQVKSSALLVAALLAGGLPASAQTAPFHIVSDTQREFTNLNVETTRGFVWSAVDYWIYGLNTNASQIVIHSDYDGKVDERWQTIANPVSIAEWRNDTLLVVGAGTHALAFHDRNSGQIYALVPLRSEPADIVVDPDLDLAYVSCQGVNEVLVVDLNGAKVIETISVPAERPRFLYFDAGAPGSQDNRVFVAPFASGNNSLTAGPAAGRQPNHGFGQEIVRVIDLDGTGYALPDQDLFEIDSTSGTSTIKPVLRHAGTLLTAHGRHPSGSYWMLNVESHNKDAARITEPSINGIFASNRVSIGAPAATTPLPQPGAIDIDDTTPAGPMRTYSASTSLAFPWSVAFHASGIALVSASMSDRIGVFDALGVRLTPFDIQLPAGSIPRHLQFDPIVGSYVIVHCWGTSELRIYPPLSQTPFAVLSLGEDPLPAPIRAGRQIWYDADRSLNGRTSCNTCHPAGKTDFLSWSLSNAPHDHKDAMVTQSLLSIEDTFPYHWRGENDLLAFNDAFTNLLGGPQKLTTGPNSEFDSFQAFVFSLQAYANPLEVVERVVSDSVGGPGVATRGQNLYVSQPSFANRSCNACHTLPTTTNSDFNLTEITFLPSQTTLEVAHLREMTHRDQVAIPGPNNVPGLPNLPLVPRSGTGLTHAGGTPNLAFAMGNFALTPAQRDDVAAFVRQIDSGLSPAAHAAILIDPQSQANAAWVQSTLEPQSSKRWIDLVAFGMYPTPQGALVTARWFHDPATGLYVSNAPAQFPTNLTTSALASLAGGGGPMQSLVFLGVPPSNGRRFALDPDLDQLIDGVEPANVLNSAWDSDSDDDTWPDGYEVANASSPSNPFSVPNDMTPPTLQGSAAGGVFVPDLVTQSVAKFFATTSEEARIEVTFSTPGLPARTYRSTSGFATVHTLVLQGLEPSPIGGARWYTASFRAIDRAGNATPLPLPTATFKSMEVINSPSGVLQPTFIVRSLTGQATPNVPAGVLEVNNALLSIENRDWGAAAAAPTLSGRTIAAQVLTRPASTGVWSVSSTFTSTDTIAPAFNVFGALVNPLALPFMILPAPYLLSSPTNAQGDTTLSFRVTGLSTGDQVKLRIFAILDQTASSPLTFFDLSLGAYQMPATPAEARELRFTY